MTKLGRWKPGESGNPGGRPPGRGQVAELREQIGKAVPKIIRKQVALALAGDVAAARLLLERVISPLKASDQAAPIELPTDGTLADQGRAIVAAAGAGDLTPAQAAQLLTGLGVQAKLIETEELALRIKALEDRLGSGAAS